MYAHGHYFVGADNGFFSILLDDFKPEKIVSLNINQKTVNTYITRIMKKLEVNSKTDLYLLARKHIKQPY